MGSKIADSRRMGLVVDICTYAKREIMPNTLGTTFPFLYFIELFCFSVILKCGGLHILGICGRTVKTRCAILHLENPALLHLG